MEGKEHAPEQLLFNQPTMVLSSGKLRSNSSAGLVSQRRKQPGEVCVFDPSHATCRSRAYR